MCGCVPMSSLPAVVNQPHRRLVLLPLLPSVRGNGRDVLTPLLELAEVLYTAK